jgi:REP element-mobilizing transposase RayT
MARKPRIQYPSAIYHVMNRGDRREPIFLDDADRELFLETLGQTCARTDWQVHAFCLMPNHFHLVLETPGANLVAGMKWFLGTYTSRFNRRHKYFGHLFSGRYKALIVDGSGSGYLKTVCDYVHLNPVRAKMLRREERMESFRWSSYGHYLQKPNKRPPWLRTNRLFGEWRIPRDSKVGRKQFRVSMEARRWEEDPQAVKRIERGWFLGSDEFRKELLAEMQEQVGPHHGGDERQETEEAKAERILTEELKRSRLNLTELKRRKKGDKKKCRIALRLREETTTTWGWIAERLMMGTGGYAADLVRVIR